MVKTRIEDWTTRENLKLIEAWAKDGLTNEQIAHNMGIHRDTLYRWTNSSADIYDALKRGKEVTDYQVENALLKRALGYEYETRRVLNNGDEVIETKHVKPDVTAQIYWLKNRKPHVWSDKQHIEHKDITNKAIDFSNITDDELRAIAAHGFERGED